MEDWKSQRREYQYPRFLGFFSLTKKHVIENSPQFHGWSKIDMRQRRGVGYEVKNLATRLCLPLCDLELVIFPL